MYAVPFILFAIAIGKVYLRAALAAVGVSSDAASSGQQTAMGRRRLQETPACTGDDAVEIQTILMTPDYYGLDSGVGCRCQSSTNNLVVCDIPREDECKDFNCNEGWECTNTSAAEVTVCATVTEEQHWEVTLANGWSRQKVVDRRYYYSGVSNLNSRTVETNRMTNPPSCGAFYVDGEECNSCERCIDENDPTRYLVVANCTNLIEFAATTCEEGNLLKKLLVLDSNATGAPTPSPSPYPTVSPTTAAPTSQPTVDSSSGRAGFAIGGVVSAALAGLVLLVS